MVRLVVDEQMREEQTELLLSSSKGKTEDDAMDPLEDIIREKKVILSYLQSALHANKPVEVIVDSSSRTFFTQLYAPPIQGTLEHQLGTQEDCMSSFKYLFSLPVEPGIGNYLIRKSKKVTFRVVTTDKTVDLVTCFKEIVDLGHGNSGLCFFFPRQGRFVSGVSEFRAKVPQSIDIKVMTENTSQKFRADASLRDMGRRGGSLVVSRKASQFFRENDRLFLQFYFEKKLLITVAGLGRYMHKMRTLEGRQFVCEFDFDVEDHATQKAIEALVARVQRHHLKEMSQISQEKGIELIA